MRQLATVLLASLTTVGATISIKDFNVNPRTGEWDAVAEAEIVGLFKNCKFDALVDVRSRHHNSNVRLTGAVKHDLACGDAQCSEKNIRISSFDTSIITEETRAIGVYCWTSPFQSTHGVHALKAELEREGYKNITLYDLKGLQYLLDMNNICPYINTPNCNTTDCRGRWTQSFKSTHAGMSVGPCADTPFVGRNYCANLAAQAEAQAREVAAQAAAAAAANAAIQDMHEVEKQIAQAEEKEVITATSTALPKLDDTLAKENADVASNAAKEEMYLYIGVGVGTVVVVAIVVAVIAVVSRRRSRVRRYSHDFANGDSKIITAKAVDVVPVVAKV